MPVSAWSRCALLVFVILPAPLAAEPPPLPTDALVLAPVGRGGRIAVPADPIQLRIASGKWTTPKAGDAFTGADGAERKWESVAFKDGAVSHRALGGGYASVVIPSPKEQVVILAASGHMMVFVNGEPRVGDFYQTGWTRLPILLKKGDNELLFHVARGALNLKLSEPRAAAMIDLADVTAPDFVLGREIDNEAAVIVQNASTEVADKLAIEATLPGGKAVRTTVPSIVPLSMRKVGFRLVGPARVNEGQVAVELRLVKQNGDKWEELDKQTLNLSAKKPEATRKLTFRSAIDGSVQYYAVVPAKPGDGKPGLVLTLHGASVEALGQAQAYAAKPALHIVAPTNRRPFGFDWEDWGRLDALEVLEHAAKELGTDPKRVYLTGHSMGGHGTWHLGVTFPDRFSAIAPSAGWVSMWSYAGAKKSAQMSPAEELLLRAANASDTLALTQNLKPRGVYILHGENDDNVPVGQARMMRKVLGEFHADFAYYEEPGVGHWWGKVGVSGSACVDWPQIFEFFRHRTLPDSGTVKSVDFRTASPAVSERCHWLTIAAQEKAMLVSVAQVRHDPAKRRFEGRTENVARLALDVGHLKAGEALDVEFDGQKLTQVAWPEMGRLWLEHKDGKWAIGAPPADNVKGPERSGPFREAFRNHVIFVYGTKGSAEENSWALAKARFDAEQFWYRGNGSIDVIADTGFDAAKEPDRNVVLYGNAETNVAWKALLGDAPIQVKRSVLRVGEREEKGDDLACLFVSPRPRSPHALVGAVSGSGVSGMRLTERLPYFTSGVGFPDWLVLDGASLSRGASAVRGAGYFGNDWRVETGESAWRVVK